MAEQSSVPARLHELAELLRRSPHLGPEAQIALAELMEELSTAVEPGHLPDPAQTHLNESADHLVQTIHQSADAGRLAGAVKRLEETAVRVEAEAPTLSGVLRRLIDALANLGV